MFLNPLDRILNKIIQQPEWEKYREYNQIIECWKQVVNQQILENTKPLYQEKAILYVATSSAVWAQELSLQRYSLIKKLNTHLSTKCGHSQAEELRGVVIGSKANSDRSPLSSEVYTQTKGASPVWFGVSSECASSLGFKIRESVAVVHTPRPPKLCGERVTFALKDIRFSAASWHNQAKKENIEIPLQEIKLPNSPKSSAKINSNSQIDVNAAVQNWLNNHQKNSQNLATCPQCQSLTPQAELTRWQVCRYCIAQKWHNEYRPTTK